MKKYLIATVVFPFLFCGMNPHYIELDVLEPGTFYFYSGIDYFDYHFYTLNNDKSFEYEFDFSRTPPVSREYMRGHWKTISYESGNDTILKLEIDYRIKIRGANDTIEVITDTYTNNLYINIVNPKHFTYDIWNIMPSHSEFKQK